MTQRSISLTSILGLLTIVGCGSDGASSAGISLDSLNTLSGTYDVAIASCSSVVESSTTSTDFNLSISGNNLSITVNFGGCISTVVAQITSLSSTSMSARYTSDSSTGSCSGLTISHEDVNFTYEKTGRILKLTDISDGHCTAAIQR